MAKKTALYETHKQLGGNVVDYAGWDLPVEYEGLVPEHEAVRNAAGLFDVSHMGEVFVSGKDANKFVQYLITNDINSIGVGQVIYTFMLNEKGGTVDDFLVYKLAEDNYLLVVNGANVEKDYKWITECAKGFDVKLEDKTEEGTILALQGPKAQEIFQKITETNLDDVKFFHWKEDVDVAGVKCLISRTGYTGEDGFEIYLPNDGAKTVWDAIMKAGEDEGIKPVGLGCRDTLRFEVNLPLYGNELGEDITPLEAGLGFFVKLDVEEDFIGKDVLVKQKADGLTRKVVGFELLGKGVPRQGYDIQVDGKKIGEITTGYRSPSIGKSIGLALVDIDHTELGTKFDIAIRKRVIPAQVIGRNFLANHKKGKL